MIDLKYISFLLLLIIIVLVVLIPFIFFFFLLLIFEVLIVLIILIILIFKIKLKRIIISIIQIIISFLLLLVESWCFKCLTKLPKFSYLPQNLSLLFFTNIWINIKHLHLFLNHLLFYLPLASIIV